MDLRGDKDDRRCSRRAGRERRAPPPRRKASRVSEPPTKLQVGRDALPEHRENDAIETRGGETTGVDGASEGVRPRVVRLRWCVFDERVAIPLGRPPIAPEELRAFGGSGRRRRPGTDRRDRHASGHVRATTRSHGEGESELSAVKTRRNRRENRTTGEAFRRGTVGRKLRRGGRGGGRGAGDDVGVGGRGVHRSTARADAEERRRRGRKISQGEGGEAFGTSRGDWRRRRARSRAKTRRRANARRDHRRRRRFDPRRRVIFEGGSAGPSAAPSPARSALKKRPTSSRRAPLRRRN